MTDGAKLDLIGQNIPISIILSDSVILLANRIKAEIFISSHEPPLVLCRRLPLFPSKKIAFLGSSARTARDVKLVVVRNSTLHVGYIDTVRPACGSDAVIVGAQPPGRSIQIVFHIADRDWRFVGVIESLSISHELTHHKGVGRVAAVKGNPREAEGRRVARGPFVVAFRWYQTLVQKKMIYKVSPDLRKHISVPIRRIPFAVFGFSDAVCNLDLPDIVQVKCTNTIIGIDNIQHISIPHDAAGMDTDGFEVVVGSRVHEHHMAILVCFAINKAEPYAFSFFIPTDDPRLMVIPGPLSESISRAGDSLRNPLLRVVIARVPSPCFGRRPIANRGRTFA